MRLRAQRSRSERPTLSDRLFLEPTLSRADVESPRRYNAQERTAITSEGFGRTEDATE
jgi:hypothetical protein